MSHGVGWLLPVVALLAAGCSDPPEPVIPPDPETSAGPTEYDPTLEPSAAVLSLVPNGATSLEVTDFDQLRLTLGFGSLDGTSGAAERAAFWRAVSGAATLSTGMLRPAEERLRPFGVSQDDVAWEARWSGDTDDGWVIAFHDDVEVASLRGAVKAGVPPLAGAVLDGDRRLVLSAEPPDGEDSWAADPELAGLVGQQANATYVERTCLPFDTVFGEGMEDQLAEAPRRALDALEPLDGFSVALGSQLVTVRLGEERGDTFERLRLHEVMPQLRPEFGSGFARGVADPSTGRLGYDLQSAEVAVQLVTERRLPFGVCGDDG